MVGPERVRAAVRTFHRRRLQTHPQGLADGIVRRLWDELGEEASVIATGGLAEHIVPHSETIDEVDDLLTLKGLKLLHERNA